MCLEITLDRVYKLYGNIDDQYLIHSNHFTHNGFESRKDVLDRYPGGSSWFRRQRFEQGIRPFKDSELSNDKIISAFSDHLSYPESVCCHPENNPADEIIGNLPRYPFRSSSATVSCVLYNLTQKIITVCKGPPCQGTFQIFGLKGQKAWRGAKDKNSVVTRSRPELP
jgi:isopenicillin-N N-acyltransferase-like protein